MIEKTQDQVMEKWKVKNSNSPLVSIECMTYNHEKFIAQALDGFLMQETTFPFEIIVHDDASTDSTAEIVREYEKKFPLIVKPIYQTENHYSKHDGSIRRILNATFKGKYIANCEGDDYWIDENKLQIQVDFLENNPDYVMCYSNFNFYHQNTNKFEYDLLNSGKQIFNPIYKSIDEWVINPGYLGPMTWVYKRDLFENYDNLNSLDGTFVMFSHFYMNGKVKAMPEKTLAVYRKLEESASHSKDLSKLYRRSVNLFETQLKLIDKYKLCEETLNNCKSNFYKKNWRIFVAMNDKKNIKESLPYMNSNIKKMILNMGKIKLFSVLYNRVYLFMRTVRNK